MKDQLEEPVERLVKRAKSVYGGQNSNGSQGSSVARGGGNSTHGTGIPKGGSGRGTTSGPSSRVSVKSALERAAADAGETEAFRKIIRALVKRFPELADEFGF